MKISSIMTAMTVALCGLSTASWSDEPDDYFDVVTAKLYSAGYSQVRWIDMDNQLLAAHDDSGKEVLIVVGIPDGNIVTVSYGLAAIGR